MVSVYQRTDSSFETALLSEIKEFDTIVWIDILQPKEEDIKQVEILFNIKLPTKHDREEIELSSRYWEDSRCIKINSYFFVSFFFVESAKSHYNESVSFVLQDNILFTVRDSELQTFDMMRQMLLSYPKEISTLQEFTLKVRLSVFDKRRILTAMAKSPKLTKQIKEDLSIMMKDINSLIEFIAIDDNTLDNLQNLFLAQTNIEQNKIIKLFTVASVALMPPTLIASIYGMNFHFIPELSWGAGYHFSLVLM